MLLSLRTCHACASGSSKHSQSGYYGTHPIQVILHYSCMEVHSSTQDKPFEHVQSESPLPSIMSEFPLPEARAVQCWLSGAAVLTVRDTHLQQWLHGSCMDFSIAANPVSLHAFLLQKLCMLIDRVSCTATL